MIEKSPLLDLTIYHWTSKKTKKTLTNIQNIYADDKIYTVIHKVSNIINTKNPIYLWTDDYSINLTTSSNTFFETNPFNSKKYDINNFKPITKDHLGQIKIINVVIKDTTGVNETYFPVYKYPQLENETQLETIIKTEPSNIDNETMKISRYNVSCDLDEKHYISIETLNKIYTTYEDSEANIFILDGYYQTYNLKRFYQNQKKLNKIIDSIYKYELISRTGVLIIKMIGNFSYIRIYINDISVSIQFICNLNDNIFLYHVLQKVAEIKKELSSILILSEDVFKNMKEENITTQIKIPTIEANKLSRYPSLFTRQNSNKKKIIYDYRRSSIDTSVEIDEVKFVLGLIKDNYSVDDIINKFQEIGEKIDKDRITQIINGEHNDQNKASKRFFKQAGTVLKNFQNGYVEVDNIPNTTELGYLLFWLSRLSTDIKRDTSKKSKADSKELEDSKEDSDSKDDSKNKKDYVIKSSSSSTSSAKVSSTLSTSTSSSSLSGGARGANPSLEEVQRLDNGLKVGWARSCQKGSQPMIMEREKFEKNKYSNIVDNHIVWNSNKDDKSTVYFCPRLWCPVSKVPIAANGKCPNVDGDETEKPINLYEKSTRGLPKDPTKPKYVKLIEQGKKPCCFSTTPKLQDNTQNSTSVSKTRNNEILTNDNPIAKNRRGTVKKIIQDFFGNIEVYRFGIYEDGETGLLLSIATTLGISVKDMISRISRTLLADPSIILLLGNGSIYKRFRGMNFKHSVSKSTPTPTPKTKINGLDKYRKTLKSIQKATKNYITFLETINDYYLNPQYIIPVIAFVFKRLLLVFKRDDINSTVRIVFPSYIKDIDDLVIPNDIKNYVAIYNNNGVYEPIIQKNNEFDIPINDNLSGFKGNNEKDYHKITQLSGVSKIFINNDGTFDQFEINGKTETIENSLTISYIYDVADKLNADIFLVDKLSTNPFIFTDNSTLPTLNVEYMYLKKPNQFGNRIEISSRMIHDGILKNTSLFPIDPEKEAKIKILNTDVKDVKKERTYKPLSVVINKTLKREYLPSKFKNTKNYYKGLMFIKTTEDGAFYKILKELSKIMEVSIESINQNVKKNWKLIINIPVVLGTLLKNKQINSILKSYVVPKIKNDEIVKHIPLEKLNDDIITRLSNINSIIDTYSFSRITGSTVIVFNKLARTSTTQVKRYDLSDLLLNINVFKGHKEKPVVMFYSDDNIYLVIDKTISNLGYYKNYYDTPKEIKAIIDVSK